MFDINVHVLTKVYILHHEIFYEVEGKPIQVSNIRRRTGALRSNVCAGKNIPGHGQSLGIQKYRNSNPKPSNLNSSNATAHAN
jgi:hypothetical protein